MATELTLAAALRDADHARPEVRGVALRNLAPALLEELGLRPPTIWTRCDHAQRAAVAAALERGCGDLAPQNIGLALLGLAQLGAPAARVRAKQGLARTGDDDADMFVRECAVIALSLLAGAQRREGTRDEALAVLVEDLRPLLDDPRDDVRFQAGPALVEALEAEAEPELVAALGRERQPEVRQNLISALAMLDPPGPAACDRMAEILDGEEGRGPIGWEIARALTAARRPEGGPRLVEALADRATRDDALEALAVLGVEAPADAAERVRKLLHGVWVPVFTRVRAAYALARIVPDEGQRALDRFARHLRASVREAAGEARTNLAKLAAEQRPPTASAYRRSH